MIISHVKLRVLLKRKRFKNFVYLFKIFFRNNDNPILTYFTVKVMIMSRYRGSSASDTVTDLYQMLAFQV
jgi:hypothetical protein